MANEQNLIPFKTKQEAREKGRKGGLVRSERKKQATKVSSRLRELKKKGLTDENAKRIYNILKDNDYSSLDIFLYLESIKKHATTANEKNNLARTLLDWHAKTHGQKLNINQETKNIHVHTTLSEFENWKEKVENDFERLRRAKK